MYITHEGPEGSSGGAMGLKRGLGIPVFAAMYAVLWQARVYRQGKYQIVTSESTPPFRLLQMVSEHILCQNYNFNHVGI